MPTSSATRLALVFPKFDIEEAQRLRLGALERLLSYAVDSVATTSSSLQYESWQSEVFRALGKTVGTEPPTAPTTWLGATGKRDTATWLHADPVLMEMSTDGMTLRATRAWSSGELELAGRLFEEHLSRTQMSWHVAEGRAFIRSPSSLSVRTVSPQHATTRSLRESQPMGDDASMLRRLMTELQMLLHEKLGDPSAPNAVWLWGVGSLPFPAQSANDLPQAWTDDAFVRGLYRLYSADALCSDLPASFDAITWRGVGRSLVVSSERRVDVLEKNWIAPAVAALDAGTLGSVEINLNGWYAIAQRSRLRRWFLRSRPLSELLREARP